MKYFKYWVQSKVPVRIGNRDTQITLLAGSNISAEDAERQALQHAQDVEHRVRTGKRREDYQVPIKEKLVEVLNDDNVITVCRYGALILNSREYTILDLDDYPIDFLDIFRGLGKLSKKERIVYKFEAKIKKQLAFGQDFRIYETAKGIRVIGKTFVAPEQPRFTRWMRALFVDWLYIEMSKRQGCYRARLTPKPFRMKIKTLKIRSPLDCDTQAYKEWAAMYAERAKDFSVVRLIKTLGRDFSHEPVVRAHDQLCNLRAEKRLA
ncbi:hypothetical protein L1F30_14200 [Simiduia sp. 21SJ11W-1]|uniref:hypothetical protein n=1 Tax=Simiduia sp. 21SJ11W-1 TaxID=2909669 RepID=UPI00209DF7CB|nr:hypothetical protein [Simiduia sp. 21SJ11W-1]UTA47310.1 hypothetical protein L1F30_14200 [Simiduia sp. 21SJ11W-1]